MTREEAIRVLTLARDDWETSHCSPMYRKEAFQMAIKSLSEDHIADADKKVSSSCGQENDMVYRQAVIDDLDEWIDIYGENKCVDAQDILKQAKRSIKKLPSAQPDTDRIYAELSKAYNVKGLPDEAIGIIGDLMLSLDTPSTQPEQRWIPCSERLPGDGERVLVTTKNGEVLFGSHLGKYWAFGSKVLAWMPLPEPYQAERREE